MKTQFTKIKENLKAEHYSKMGSTLNCCSKKANTVANSMRISFSKGKESQGSAPQESDRRPGSVHCGNTTEE